MDSSYRPHNRKKEENFLQVGDIFNLENGHKIMASIPEKFAYGNCAFSKEMSRTTIVVGETKRLDSTDKVIARGGIAKKVIEAFESQGAMMTQDIADDIARNYTEANSDEEFTYKPGEFIVMKTTFDGGSTGRDAYPDGHHIHAQRLNENGTYNPEGEKIDFYQSGCFTNEILDLVKTRTMKVTTTVTVTVDE